MIFHVARKEWLEMMRDGRFRIGAALIALVLLSSLALGAAHQKALRTERDTARQISRTQWVTQADKDPHNASHDGLYIVKTPSPLAFFDPGVSRYTGSAVLITSHKRNEAILRGARDIGVAGRFGALSAALVLQLLVPLFIVLLGFGAFASERESGTLRQVLATGISRRALLGGKLLGLCVALGVLLIPATLAGGVALRLSLGAQGTTADEAMRVALLVLVYGVYFAIFVLLTLAVSAWMRTARGALTVLLGFWALTSLLVPRVASDAGRALYPVPSATRWTAWVDEAKTAQAKGEKPAERIKRLQADLMKQHGVSRLEDLPVNWHGVLLQHSEDQTNRAFDRVYARLSGIYARQNTLFDGAALVAPSLSVRSLSMALSGTDGQAYQRFSDDVERYRREWVRLLNADLAAHPHGPGEAYEAGREVWESVPPFEHRPLTVRQVLRAQTPGLAVLGLWLVLSVGMLAGAIRGMRL